MVFRLIIHSTATARSVMTPTDVARRARGTASAVVIHHDHRLHCGGVQVLGAGGLHHLKIRNCVKKFVMLRRIFLTFPASWGDDVMMLILCGWDTTIVGVDCITWTRCWLLLLASKVRIHWVSNKIITAADNKSHLSQSAWPDCDKWHRSAYCLKVKDSARHRPEPVDFRLIRAEPWLECWWCWCLPTTSTWRHCRSSAVSTDCCRTVSGPGDVSDAGCRRLDDR